jgi:hypothetical protein
MTAPTETQRQGLALLGRHSSGYFDPWRVAGDHNAALRQQIMLLLTGQKTPRAKSGVGAITAALYAIHNPDPDNTKCGREKEAAFEAWAKSILETA